MVQEETTRGLAALSSGPKLDLSLKEGQTITINMPVCEWMTTCVITVIASDLEWHVSMIYHVAVPIMECSPFG